jgi:peptidoglycan/LPS O-acetylase OafA/YrhL
MDAISSFCRRYWLRGRRNILVIVCGLIAILILSIPVQHYMAIARYQHYGTAICIFGLGYLLQDLVSWRNLRTWGRVSYLATGSFFLAIGVIFINNSWLDGRVSPQTEDQEFLRIIIQSFYLICGLIVSGIWFCSVYEDLQAESREKMETRLLPK